MGACAEFLASRRSKATRDVYGNALKRVVGDVDAFLEFARSDSRAPEQHLIGYVISAR